MATRRQLVDAPRSGARPLFGDEQTELDLPRRPAPRRPSTSTAAPTSTSSPRRPRRAASSDSRNASRPAPDVDEDQGDEPDRRGRGRGVGAEGAGAILALFIYPLVVNLLEGGPAQMWAWVRAKWTNQAYGQGPNPASGQLPRGVQQIRLPNGAVITGSNITGITGYTGPTS